MAEISRANSSHADCNPSHPNHNKSLGLATSIRPDGPLPENKIAMEERVVPLNHEAKATETTDDRRENHQNGVSHREHQPMPVVPEKSVTTSQDSAALETAGSPTRRNFFSRILCLMADLWVWEILSCVLATICLVIIVATLAVHQGRPLPQWPDYISINSLIAIMTAIMKASLMLPVVEGTLLS
jgi:hypothetical protein